MKKTKKFFQFVMGVCALIVMSVFSGGFAMAAVTPGSENAGAAPDGETVAEITGGEGGKIVEGARTVTGEEKIMDNEWFLKQVNKAIVEMKFCGTPVDQILRSGTTNKSDSIVVKYYSVGQRPLTVKLAAPVEGSTKQIKKLEIENTNILGQMDTLLALDEDGNFIMGTDNYRPLMLRVKYIGEDNLPYAYAVNGTAAGSDDHFNIPALPAGTTLLRMGRAAAEKDVNTGAYYQLPEPTEQYCQRFIMEVEESVYSRFSKTELDWTFTRMEKMAMEDMRIGMEATGLFGVKSKHTIDRQGIIYTTEGIWYRAGKDLELGHWEIAKDANGNPITVTSGEKTYYQQEYVITENELIDLVADINEGAGNSSRKKMVFVDKTIYSALCKIKTNNRVRLLEKVDNYMNLGLDFQSYTSMGTTLMFYRHDLFNEWGFEGRAFSLDAEYLDKWVFMDWSREEYDLKKLYLRNANSVVMEEFSCWTLSFPDAHARIAMPAYEEKLVA